MARSRASCGAFDTGHAHRSMMNMAPQPVAVFPSRVSTVAFA